MPACDITQLHGLIRHAVHMLKGIRLQLSADTFSCTAVSVVPLLKILERYAGRCSCHTMLLEHLANVVSVLDCCEVSSCGAAGPQ